MAWTAPRTWTSGELVKADDLNTHVRDNQAILKVPIGASGKVVALTSTYFDSIDTSALTGIAKLAGANSFTGKNDFNAGASARVLLPTSATWYS
jgi:hypothetical protein